MSTSGGFLGQSIRNLLYLILSKNLFKERKKSLKESWEGGSMRDTPTVQASTRSQNPDKMPGFTEHVYDPITSEEGQRKTDVSSLLISLSE